MTKPGRSGVLFLSAVCLLSGLLELLAFADVPELDVYVYDSFAAKGGLGPEVVANFQKTCGCTVRLLPSGDGAQLVSRLQIDAERGHPAGSVVVGLDEPAFERAKAGSQSVIEPWGSWQPQGYRSLEPFLKKQKDFLPFDYGYFAFIADTQALNEQKMAAPTRFDDLFKPEMRRNLILEDPRTSTPGLAFVLYALAVSTQADLWTKLRPQWLTLAAGWDAAYGLFLRKEAPLVWSYTTSQAYHEEHGDSTHRYQALILDGAQPLQIEGAALVRGAFEGPGGGARRKLAQKFLESLLSSAIQKQIPSRNWMYPVVKTVKLPASFAHLPVPGKKISLPFDSKSVDAAMKSWSDAVQK